MDDKGPKQRQHFKEWLEKLQQESWQLELLVTGFAIVLLIGAFDLIRDWMLHVKYLSSAIQHNFIFQILAVVALVGWLFLLLNLILHVLLRGLWISAIGLRYVSGDIDIEKLHLSKRFHNFLKKRLRTFDEYIELLERLASIVFAFTFLLVFIFISFALYLIVLDLLLQGNHFLLAQSTELAKVANIISQVFIFAYFLMGIIYFIDFITLGSIKKSKRLSRLYFPIYRFMGVITLSFLYRHLYYNLLDNPFGRKVGRILVPYMVFVLFITSIKYQTHPFFPVETTERTTLINDYYEDQLPEKTIILTPLISSRFISNAYLDIFIPYMPKVDDNAIQKLCPELEPPAPTGFSTDIIVYGNKKPDKEKKAHQSQETLECLSQLYRLSISNQSIPSPIYYFHEHYNHGEKGLRTTIDLDSFPRGAYQLLIEKQRLHRDSLLWEKYSYIPFWKE